MSGDERNEPELGHEEETSNAPTAAKSELVAALGHLKNAAELLIGAADPAVRKAATQAEKALEKVGREAEPMARQLSTELGKMTRSLIDVFEGRGHARKSEPPSQESDIERLEREASRSDERKD